MSEEPIDPICHTLVGASLAETGLRQRTALGTATLLIAANVPDVDVLAYFWGSTTALAVRRGVTHGVLALVVWPFLLLGIALLWDRAMRRRRGRIPDRAVMPRQILLLGFLGVLTHPTLDFLNTYGMRWLAPFSSQWFYADTLFIVDPWVWGLLAVGIVLARRQGHSGWNGATVSLAVLGAYVLAMAGSGLYARRLVHHELAERGVAAERLMVAPTPVTPFSRRVVAEAGGAYRVGRLRFFGSPRLELDGFAIPTAVDPRAQPSLDEREARDFLSWARFPFVVVSGATVWIGDARYGVDPEVSWAAVALRRQAAER